MLFVELQLMIILSNYHNPKIFCLLSQECEVTRKYSYLTLSIDFIDISQRLVSVSGFLSSVKGVEIKKVYLTNKKLKLN